MVILQPTLQKQEEKKVRQAWVSGRSLAEVLQCSPWVPWLDACPKAVAATLSGTQCERGANTNGKLTDWKDKIGWQARKEEPTFLWENLPRRRERMWERRTQRELYTPREDFPASCSSQTVYWVHYCWVYGSDVLVGECGPEGDQYFQKQHSTFWEHFKRRTEPIHLSRASKTKWKSKSCMLGGGVVSLLRARERTVSSYSRLESDSSW